MRERQHIKFRTDMYEDTKFKIIDRMVKRDLIHYVWNRSVILAGKINREGDLYLSKNIPYTVETLAIEFNRDTDDVETALNVLIELEMIEFIDDKVYRVKNFAKHQNIKVKEKTETKEEVKIEDNHKDNDIIENKAMVKEVYREDGTNELRTEKNEKAKEQLNKFDVMPLIEYVEMKSDSENKSDDKKEEDKNSSMQHNNSPVILETKKKQKISRKSGKVNKNKNIDEIIEMNEDNIENMEEKEDVCIWSTGEGFSLKDGERLVSEWAF